MYFNFLIFDLAAILRALDVICCFFLRKVSSTRLNVKLSMFKHVPPSQWTPGSVVRVLYDYKPTSKSAIPLKRGEYIVVMPVRTESSNSHSESNRSASENPNGPMWIAGSKITGRWLLSVFICGAYKVGMLSPKKVSTLTAQQ